MIRVLIVDDSVIVRKVFTEALSKYEDIEVIGSAIDPFAARDQIVSLRPDVITLDLEMPRMDGLSFLEKLMKHYPMPVVVVSSLTPEHSEPALRALALGAIDVIAKPGSLCSTPDMDHLARAIRAAAGARVGKRPDGPPSPPVYPAPAPPSGRDVAYDVLAIGASIGGTQAIEVVLRGLPVTAPGTVIVQHMPEHFTAAFAKRLNQICALEVREARDGDPVVTGVALVAPGNRHMVLQRSGPRYFVQIKDGPAVHHQRPAVDVLFQSVARHAGPQAIGVLLTGMGLDGAKGLLAMRRSGAATLAQDEASCVVFGMPKEAVRLNAVQKIVPLSEMAPTILKTLSGE